MHFCHKYQAIFIDIKNMNGGRSTKKNCDLVIKVMYHCSFLVDVMSMDFDMLDIVFKFCLFDS